MGTEQRKKMVRIGIAIRQKEIAFSIAPSRAATPEMLPPGEYLVRNHSPSSGGSWGLRAKSFLREKDAEDYFRMAHSLEVDAEIHCLGHPVELADGELLETRIWTISVGHWTNEKAARREGSILLRSLPTALMTTKYPDEIPSVEPIRLDRVSGGELELQHLGNGEMKIVPSPLFAVGVGNGSGFSLQDVRIGIDFHWDHRESLFFRGGLELFADGDSVTAVNPVSIRSYLESLLGSEMRPDWPLESLAAQAVAARSTILATRERHHYGEVFDLCHDDHCQCYQGISRESELAGKALDLAGSHVLVAGNRILDARYAKTCGGVTDWYSTAWEEWRLPGLEPVHCSATPNAPDSLPDFSCEKDLLEYMEHDGKGIACNPAEFPYPASVKEMESLYHWNFHYTREQLTELIHSRIKEVIGDLADFQVLERSISGRIKYLRVFGSKGQFTIGKELAIRRLLSPTHLPSSAFVIHRLDDGFRFEGIGWGHGVGLCQLGSVSLARNGWSWKKILDHYYPGSKVMMLSGY